MMIFFSLMDLEVVFRISCSITYTRIEVKLTCGCLCLLALLIVSSVFSFLQVVLPVATIDKKL